VISTNIKDNFLMDFLLDMVHWSIINLNIKETSKMGKNMVKVKSIFIQTNQLIMETIFKVSFRDTDR
jgi:hypothetical protein